MALCGVWGGLWYDIPPSWLLIPAWLTFFPVFLLRRHPVSVVFLYGSIFLTAWVHADLSTRKPSAREIASQMERPREHVVLRGIIAADPESSPGRRPGESDWRFPLRVKVMQRLEYPQRASGRVDVQWNGVPDGTVMQYGEYWELSGVLTDRTSAGTRRWHLSPYRLWVSGDDHRRISSGHGSRYVAFCYRMRHRCWDLLGRGLDEYPEEAGIVRALLLGYRHELPEEHHRLFASTGTLHIFAISGLHVGVMSLLIMGVLKSFGMSRHHAVYGLAPLLIMYTVATGMRPSAVRAGTMALLYASAFLFRRKPDPPSALAWAALLIVAAAPGQLVAPGFIYSFVIVGGLMRLYPVCAGSAAVLVPEDPRPAAYRPEGRKYGRYVALWIVGLGGISVAAWLSSAPLTAFYFNRVSPVALLTNILVIPAAFLVVMTACLSLVGGMVWGVLAEIFNHANRFFLSGLTWLMEGCAQVPGGHFHVASPPVLWIVWWYGLLFGGLLVRGRRIRVWALCGALTMAGMGIWSQWTDRSIAVDVLDTMDGQAALIRLPCGSNVLYDAGPRHGSWLVLRHLRQRGVNRLDALVLSTPTAPYAGAAEELMEALPIGEIWMPPQEGRSPAYRRVVEAARRHAIPVRKRMAGETGSWGAVEWEILHPADEDSVRRAADAALVMRVANEGASVIFMGGGGDTAERRILDAPIEPSSPILVYGNQGAPGTASEAWLDAVSPTDVIISAGGRSRDGFPDEEVLSRLQDHPVQIWRTDRDGVIHIRLSSSALRGTPALYHRITTASRPVH